MYDVTIAKDGAVPPAANLTGQKGVILKNPTGPDVNRRIMMKLVKSYDLNNIEVFYDGRSNLYTSRRLPFAEKNFEVEVRKHEDVADSQNSKFAVTIKLSKEINMKQIGDFITGKKIDGKSETPQECLNAIDIILGHAASYKFVNRGRSFYTSEGSFNLGGGVDAWAGFFQSVRALKTGLYLNVDVSATAFHQPKRVLDIAVDVWRKQRPEDLFNYSANERDVRELEKSIKLCKVKMEYRSDYARVMRVEGVSRKSAFNVTFQCDGVEVSVANFFEKTYNYRLKYPNLPCIIAGSKKAHIPLELCTVLPSQIFKRKINDLQTASMIKFTCKKPDERARRINDGIDKLNPGSVSAFKDIGLSVDSNMVSVKGRILDPPSILYSKKTMRPNNGSWNLRDLAFQRGAVLKDWGVLVLADNRDININAVQRFVGELVNMAGRTGLRVEQRQPPIVYGSPEGRGLQMKMHELHSQLLDKGSGLRFVLVILRGSKDVYADVKRLTDTEMGIPSQCMLIKHAIKASPQYIGNLLLKINSKLGGVNSSLEAPLPLFDRPTIVFGADVTHPSGGSNGPSIVAIVASMDVYLASYSTVIQTQEGKMEHIAKLDEAVKQLLLTFYQKSNRKPAAIVFYRDGVSEGQFTHVFDSEVRAIQQACLSIQPDGSYQPPITFIVVQKRHHIRFFPQKGDEDKSGNAVPGTVIDSDIVHPTEFDFWLMSHSGIQGTSRPARYCVLLDQNKFSSNAIQEFTYRMCYTFVRCTRSVSVVPPVYYAHLLAFRARYLAAGDMWDSDTASEVSHKSSDTKILEIHQNLKKNLPMFFV
jgi:hypothetical protein